MSFFFSQLCLAANDFALFLLPDFVFNPASPKDIFLTLNPFFEIDSSKIYNQIEFTHPYYDEKALNNQSKLKDIQNINNTLFAGSYFGYGFHEDGIKSSIEMLKTIND